MATYSPNSYVPGTTQLKTGWGIGYGAGTSEANKPKLSANDEIERTRTVIGNRTTQGLDTSAQLAHYKNMTGQSYVAPTQTVTSPQTPAFDQNAYLQKSTDSVNSIYDRQKESQLAALRAQRDQAVGNINQQKSEVAPQYADKRNQSDVVSAQNVQRLREAMASAGLTSSGENVSAQVSQSNQRQSSLNSLNLQEQQTMDDYNRQISDLMNPASEQALIAQLEAQRSQALYDAMVRADDTGYNRSRDSITDGRYVDETNYNRGRDTTEDTRYYNEQDYNRNRDTVADARYTNETMYNRGRDAVGDSQWNKQFEYGQSRDQVSDGQWNKQFDSSNSQWQQQFDTTNGQWNKQFDQQNKDAETERAWRTYAYNNMSASEQANLDWSKTQYGEDAAWRMYETQYNGELAKGQYQAEIGAYSGGGGTGLDFLP